MFISPEDVHKEVEWFHFPIIDESVRIYEDAPTDSFDIPVNAEQKTTPACF